MASYLERAFGPAYEWCRLAPEEVRKLTPHDLRIMQTAAVKRFETEQKLHDARTARICALIGNIYRDEKKKPRPFTPKEFMPVYWDDEAGEVQTLRETTGDEMLEMARCINQFMGGDEQ